jgi:hypothetical protein
MLDDLHPAILADRRHGRQIMASTARPSSMPPRRPLRSPRRTPKRYKQA